MDLAARKARQLAHIQVRAEIDLLGILGRLPQPARGIAGGLGEIIGAQRDALGLQLRPRPAPIPGHIVLLQPVLQGLGLGHRRQEHARQRGGEDGATQPAPPMGQKVSPACRPSTKALAIVGVALGWMMYWILGMRENHGVTWAR